MEMLEPGAHAEVHDVRCTAVDGAAIRWRAELEERWIAFGAKTDRIDLEDSIDLIDLS